MSVPARKPDASLAPHGVLADHYQQPQERERLVRTLFDAAAPEYDRLSSLLSFGSDRWYRRQVMRRLGAGQATHLLDVATGTGLLVRAALEQGCQPNHIVGLDPSSGMLASHNARTQVNLVQGRGERLPFKTAEFDLVTVGYALRHVADLRELFTELHRVLRPGGQLAILEITRPKSVALRRLIRFYFARVVPRLLGRNRRPESSQLMAYYCSTIEECVAPTAIVDALGAAGFGQVNAKSTGPVLTDFVARKPA